MRFQIYEFRFQIEPSEVRCACGAGEGMREYFHRCQAPCAILSQIEIPEPGSGPEPAEG